MLRCRLVASSMGVSEKDLGTKAGAASRLLYVFVQVRLFKSCDDLRSHASRDSHLSDASRGEQI